MSRPRALLAGALLCTAALAAMAQRPPGVLGLELGQTLALPACPPSAPGTPLPPLCAEHKGSSQRDGRWVDTYEIFVPLDSRPPWALRLTADVADGKVDRLTLWTSGVRSQADALEAATERLGRPSISALGQRTFTHAGKLLPAQVASWEGSSWRGRFDAAADGPTSGRLTIERVASPAAQEGKKPL